MSTEKLSPTEGIKTSSRGLRGTLAPSLVDSLTGQVAPDDQQLIKFHGIYQQDDRDRREERERKKLEPDYSFMLRLRIPGGEITGEQWRGIENVAGAYSSTGVIKITTRQTVQLHGLIKAKLKPTVQDFAKLGLDSIAACGDVNRNVMAGSNPSLSKFHDEVFAFADKISTHLLPKTTAFAEIWLDGEKLTGDEPEEDPLYQNRYLPRKFKIAIAIPPHNETDIFTNDIGLIAIEENGRFIGFNIAIGGGLGTTHGNAETYPRLASIIGFIPKEATLDTVWQVLAVQRDFGNRVDRKLSRLKYTVERMGVDGFKAELESRLGTKIAPEKPFHFTSRGDVYGWLEDHAGLWYYTAFVENGRVLNQGDYRIADALHEIGKTNACGFRFTGNQNVMLTRITAKDKKTIEKILAKHGIGIAGASPIRLHALACVAMNPCPLALAEGQRYLPSLISKIEPLLSKHGIAEEPISIRMTGCPNGCARPYVAEIGLVGKSLGKYNVMLGADALGQRLNWLYAEEKDEGEILAILDDLFGKFASGRKALEGFGDFIARTEKKAA